MSLVLTAIADPDRSPLDSAVLDRLVAAVTATNVALSPPQWLSENEAVDFDIGADDRGAILQAAQTSVRGLAVDVAVQPKANRRKRLLIADMDSTIIQQECIDELADAMGLRDTVSAITERAMRGEIAFDDALRERAAMLAGLAADAMDAVYQERIKVTPGAATLVATMRANGALTALVSGGFTFFTQRIRARVGFDIDQANELLLDDQGRLSGQVAAPILGRAAKVDALKSLAQQHGVGLEEAMAVGDGANDLAMIEAAGLGVAFHAKPTVAAQADVESTHTNLTALLLLQGYKRADFVTPA